MENAFEILPREFISAAKFCDYKTPVMRIVDDVKKFGAVIVTKQGSYFGVVDTRTMARTQRSKLTKNFPVGKLAVRAPLIDEGTSIENAILHFHNTSIKVLPYVEKNKIRGVIRREKILSAMLSLHMLSKFKVSEGMSAPAIGIDKNANLAQAIAIMRSNNINRLLVMDNSTVFGILTYADIMGMLSKPSERMPESKSEKFSLSNISVSSVCAKEVYSIEQESSIEDAMRQFLEKDISSLLVTRDGKPTGVITVSDVFGVAVANSTAAENNIIISGLDDYTREYEDEIRGELDKVASKVGRFNKLKVDSIALNVRRRRERNYEMKARVMLNKRGSIIVYSNGYTINETLKDLVDKIYKKVKTRKEEIVTYKKSKVGAYGEV
ncbi:MAG: CBS domain-containing protein [Candidatus Micrarchaeaceae archaeon]